MSGIVDLSLSEMARALAERRLSAGEIVEAHLARIVRVDRKLGAFVEIWAEEARAFADASDRARDTGLPVARAAGLPIGLKDLVEVEGRITSFGSALWPDRVSGETAQVYRHIRAHEMIPIGKTHTVEFARGGWGTNPHLGTPWNPWDLSVHRVPGGSSSGSAVAVAAGMAPAAIGSDTGGSIRVPAAFCGLVGLKTTPGLVDLAGILPLSPSLDTVGPLTRTCADAALVMDVITDPTRRDPRGYAGVPASVHGRRFAVLADPSSIEPLHPAVEAGLDDTVRALRSAGARVEVVTLPLDLMALREHANAITSAEAYAWHRDWIDTPEGIEKIGPGVRARIMPGRDVSAADLIAAQSARRIACATFLEFLGAWDAVLTPMVAFPAPPVATIDETDARFATFSRWVNYLELPGLAVPAGSDENGLPVAIQLVGKPFAERDLLGFGSLVEAALGTTLRRPDFAGL